MSQQSGPDVAAFLEQQTIPEVPRFHAVVRKSLVDFPRRSLCPILLTSPSPLRSSARSYLIDRWMSTVEGEFL